MRALYAVLLGQLRYATSCMAVAGDGMGFPGTVLTEDHPRENWPSLAFRITG